MKIIFLSSIPLKLIPFYWFFCKFLFIAHASSLPYTKTWFTLMFRLLHFCWVLILCSYELKLIFLKIAIWKILVSWDHLDFFLLFMSLLRLKNSNLLLRILFDLLPWMKKLKLYKKLHLDFGLLTCKHQHFGIQISVLDWISTWWLYWVSQNSHCCQGLCIDTYSWLHWQFCHIMKGTIACVVLFIIVTNKWPLCQFDVKNAFLNDTPNENVYMVYWSSLP